MPDDERDMACSRFERDMTDSVGEDVDLNAGPVIRETGRKPTTGCGWILWRCYRSWLESPESRVPSPESQAPGIAIGRAEFCWTVALLDATRKALMAQWATRR